jgi:hypothetical protein
MSLRRTGEATLMANPALRGRQSVGGKPTGEKSDGESDSHAMPSSSVTSVTLPLLCQPSPQGVYA